MIGLEVSDNVNLDELDGVMSRFRKFIKMTDGIRKIKRIYLKDKKLKKRLSDYKCKIVNKFPYNKLHTVIFLCHGVKHLEDSIEQAKQATKKEKKTIVYIYDTKYRHRKSD